MAFTMFLAPFYGLSTASIKKKVSIQDPSIEKNIHNIQSLLHHSDFSFDNTGQRPATQKPKPLLKNFARSFGNGNYLLSLRHPIDKFFEK